MRASLESVVSDCSVDVLFVVYLYFLEIFCFLSLSSSTFSVWSILLSKQICCRFFSYFVCVCVCCCYLFLLSVFILCSLAFCRCNICFVRCQIQDINMTSFWWWLPKVNWIGCMANSRLNWKTTTTKLFHRIFFILSTFIFIYISFSLNFSYCIERNNRNSLNVWPLG